MDSVSESAISALPRVAQGAMGLVDIGVGVVEVGAGAALTAGTDGLACVPGMAVMGSGVLTIGDGAAGLTNAITGSELHTTLGEVGKKVAGENGALAGDILSGAHSVNGARIAAVELAEKATVKHAARAVAETASAANATKESLKKEEKK